MTVTRREALTTLGLGTVMAATFRPLFAETGVAAPPAGPFSLPPLPYSAAALEPHIDTQTMEIHHGRHHQAYVDNLNEALKGAPDLAKKPIEELLANLQAVPKTIRTAVRNNGGGHVNHTMFWAIMTPKGGGPPAGAIADGINSTFGSFDRFKEQMSQAAADRFGSGWVWLSDEKGQLVIHSTPNQDTPSMEGKRAIFGIDVWSTRTI